MKQIALFPAPVLFHGGILARGKRKTMRPLSKRKPLHLVLKASRPVLYKNREIIHAEVQKKCAHFGLTAYSVAVEWNHIHFVLRLPGRSAYRAFVRALTGVLARRFGKGIWKLSPFSRVLHWGKEFRQVLAYLKKNREEACGARPYEPTKKRYPGDSNPSPPGDVPAVSLPATLCR